VLSGNGCNKMQKIEKVTTVRLDEVIIIAEKDTK
jgi:hypothetical protein